LAGVHDFIANKPSVAGVDEVLTTTDADFAPSGLKIASVIRLTRLAVVSQSIFVGIIGEISAKRLKVLKKAGKLD
jgi:mRNA interferase MazF